MTDTPSTPPPPPPSQPPAGGAAPPPPSQPPAGGGGAAPPTPPPTGGSDSDRTIMIVLGYLGILALIPLLIKKDDREVQWHAKNGLMLFVGFFVVSIVFWILQFVMGDVMGLGCVLSLLSCVIWIGYLVLIIMAIMKGVNGQRMRFPVVSDMADKM